MAMNRAQMFKQVRGYANGGPPGTGGITGLSEILGLTPAQSILGGAPQMSSGVSPGLSQAMAAPARAEQPAMGGFNLPSAFDPEGADVLPGMMDPLLEALTPPPRAMPEAGSATPGIDEEISSLNNLMRERLTSAKQFNFEEMYDKNLENLRKLQAQPASRDIYDLASTIGRAMLSADPRAGAFRSMGAGFAEFSREAREEDAKDQAREQAIAVKAYELAQQDQTAARNFLDQYALESIKQANKPPRELKTTIYEYLDPDTGKVIRESVSLTDIDRLNELNAMTRRGDAKEVKSAGTQVTVSTGAPAEAGKRAAQKVDEITGQWREEYLGSRGMQFKLNEIERLANGLEDAQFGQVGPVWRAFAGTLAGLGVADPEMIDKLAAAEGVGSLGTRIAMGLVGQTKGAISNAEMDLFLRASPGLATSKAGMLKQVELLRRIAEKQEKFYQDFRNARRGAGETYGVRFTDEEGNRLTGQEELDAIDDWMIAYHSANPLLSDEERVELESLAGGEDPNAKKFRTQYSAELFSDEGVSADVSGFGY